LLYRTSALDELELEDEFENAPEAAIAPAVIIATPTPDPTRIRRDGL
jgi:hypothetical protein